MNSGLKNVASHGLESFNDNKTSMTIFETTEEKAKNYFEQYSKVCAGYLDIKIYQWNALPLFTILERIQGQI